MRSPHVKFRHGALLIKGGSVIAFAHNTRQHAEAAVLKKVTAQQAKNSIMWTARINKNDIIGNSYPCSECIDVIEKFGVKEVYYTTSEGNIKSVYGSY